MRRNTTLALVLAAALAAVLWLVFGARDVRTPVASEPEPAPDVVAPAAVLDDTPLVEAESGADAVVESARTEVVAARPALAPPTRCIVFGRLLDDHGAPIAGAAVRLCAYKVWAEGVEVPRLSGRIDYRGFEVMTAASGEFRVDAPVPTAERTLLSIRPDRFHDSVSMYFATSGDRVSPALSAGERDLGDLRVANTGAVRGRVLDDRGAPLAGIDVGLGGSSVSTLERDTETEADGSYVIAHAPTGSYGVRVRSDAHLLHFEPDVTVAAGRDTFVKDIVLQTAPTLAGTVVDENGKPIAGVRLNAWPVGSGGGEGAYGRSGPDGHFMIPLPQSGSYTLAAERQGFLDWGSAHDQTITYASDRRDIEIVMRSLPRTRFNVVDAESGASIERFGVSILQDGGSQAPRRVSTEHRPPQQRARPGGFVEVPARAGLDQYVFAADGYVLAVGDVAHDVADVPVQTVRMSRGSGVRGRVLREGTPLVDALVEIVQLDGHAMKPDGKVDKDRWYVKSESRRATRTDSEGRFAFSALDTGECRLTVRPATGARLVMQPVRVKAKKTNDLGDLNVLAGATIAGELLVPAGFDPAGLEVYLDDWKDDVTSLVDASGRFRFENVPAGVRFLEQAERAGALAGGEPVRVEVKAGETRTVTLDARDRAMCAVELQIELGTLAAGGVQVDLIPEGEWRRTTVLGNCDASGRVSGAVRAFGKAHVGVWLRGTRLVKHPDAVLDLHPFGKVEATVRFEFVQLDVRVLGALPRDGRLRFHFAPHAAGAETETIEITYKDGVVLGESAVLAARADRVSIGGLFAGACAVTLEVFDDKADPANVARHRARVHAGETPTYRATAEIELVAGKTLEIEM